VILKPVLLASTKRRWIDGHKLPAAGGCVLASNHVSHVDPVTFAHFVYDYGRLPRFLAKSELFAVPVLGRLVRGAGQIPVTRLTAGAATAFASAVDAVDRGECVVVYPEGTITREPDLWPMVGKTGAARIAMATESPVIPAAQWGPQEILAPYSTRPHLFPRKTVTVKVGDPVDLADLRAQPLTPSVLGEATDRIMDAITRLLEDIRGQAAPEVRFDPRVAGVKEVGNPFQSRKKRTGRRR
jgi:1-acyl-sn-glycerol-3-phosphate acyltransferase